MNRLRTTALVAGGVPLIIVALIVAAWAIDTSASGGEVLRNVSLAERDIGGLGRADLGVVLNEIGADIASVGVTITSEDTSARTTAGALGVSVDEEATSSAAMDVGRDRAFLVRPFVWLWSFFDGDEAPLVLSTDPGLVASALDELDELADVPPTEPTLTHRDGALEVVSGAPGRSIDPSDVARALGRVDDVDADGIHITVEPVETLPSVADEEAQALADAVGAALAAPLPIEVATPAPGDGDDSDGDDTDGDDT
ncbi:MAG: peptidoglycan binding domain-containing protein, partial [Actinomycetota bacterium]|nr:peptidoglycan binding domain-containing protein [Actinomycetota bacterium]